tara:strand:+ start:422 stop:661 length:240 start_codon:yes stop_codon:yes gene_type:complete
MEHRGIKYKKIEWKSQNGTECSGYECSDKSLLIFTNITTLGEKTAYGMRKEIDYYLDNMSHCKRIQELELAAGIAFYAN